MVACGYQLWVVDIDGVVWRGSEPIGGNIAGLKRVIEEGSQLVFLTNNSTRHRKVYAGLLSTVLGFPVAPESVYTSGYAASRWLLEEKGRLRVYPVGEEGLLWELVEAGHIVVGVGEVAGCMVDAVVAGLDRTLSYEKLRWAHRAVRRCGALFVATNTDRTLPLEGGLDDPGAGPIVEAIKTSTGREPVFTAGKPNPWILRLVLREKGVAAEKTIVVGDRVETDMELARRAGVRGLLVLTGATREAPRGGWFDVAPDILAYVSNC